MKNQLRAMRRLESGREPDLNPRDANAVRAAKGVKKRGALSIPAWAKAVAVFFHLPVNPEPLCMRSPWRRINE